jgi:hypothetical protein
VKSGRQKGGQELLQGVDDQVRHVLRAGTQMEDGKNLGAGIYGQPEHLCGAAQPGAQFVQLEVGNLEGVEAVLVQGLSVLASAR